jgi:hypothetical protein
MNPVDRDIYDGVASATTSDFAFSYLVKAEQRGRNIIPYTVTAWERLKQSSAAMRELDRHGVKLIKPDPWSPDREERKKRQQMSAPGSNVVPVKTDWKGPQF